MILMDRVYAFSPFLTPAALVLLIGVVFAGFQPAKTTPINRKEGQQADLKGEGISLGLTKLCYF
jgi:hypothetical protein